MNKADEDFSPDERARARDYHRPLYLALIVDLALAAGVLAALAWSPSGLALLSADVAVAGGRRRGVRRARTDASRASSAHRSRVARLVARATWGFSTQGAGGWLADRSKGLAVSIVLGAGAWAAAVALARALPGWWAVPAAPPSRWRCSCSRSSLRRPRTALQPVSAARRRGARGPVPSALERAGVPVQTFSSPTRAAARRRSTPTSRASAGLVASSFSTRCWRRRTRAPCRSSSRTSSGIGGSGMSRS